VDRALPIVPAELLQLELLGHGLLVLGRRVVPTFALGALEGDDFARCCHGSVSARIENWELRIEKSASAALVPISQFSILNPQFNFKRGALDEI
jgi:hypothetical protein